MKPELSKAHLGIADRDLEYEAKVQLQPHIVYLALSSEVKVGVTRKTQVPTRWIDQGAVQAIPIVEVPNRYLAGITEVALKNYYADKTNWQKCLTGGVPLLPSLMDIKQSFVCLCAGHNLELNLCTCSRMRELWKIRRDNGGYFGIPPHRLAICKQHNRLTTCWNLNRSGGHRIRNNVCSR